MPFIGNHTSIKRREISTVQSIIPKDECWTQLVFKSVKFTEKEITQHYIHRYSYTFEI